MGSWQDFAAGFRGAPPPQETEIQTLRAALSHSAEQLAAASAALDRAHTGLTTASAEVRQLREQLQQTQAALTQTRGELTQARGTTAPKTSSNATIAELTAVERSKMADRLFRTFAKHIHPDATRPGEPLHKACERIFIEVRAEVESIKAGT